MKKYQVEITEISQRLVTVVGDYTEREAIAIAKRQYDDGEVIITPEDLKEVSFDIYKDTTESN